MKAFLFLSLIFLVSAIERKANIQSKFSTAETVDEEASLVKEILILRQGYNLNLGNNELDRIEELDLSSSAESEYLLENVDTFGTQKNFQTEVKSQQLSPDQYFTEIVAKLQDATKSDPVQQIISLWQNDKEISDHLKLEYNQVGCSCKLYGNGRICVMHLRQY